jgi:EAL domain-containing protein (putative c-di-GMP-specific phosphodiesterase class I)
MAQSLIETEEIESIGSELLEVHFQPIVNLKDGALLGYECLSRGPKGTPLEDPEVLFREAMRRNLSFELERECQKRLLMELKGIPHGVSIFVNLEPHLIQSGEFVDLPLFLAIDHIDPGKVVIELTERHYSLDSKELKKNVNFIRSLGFKVALDDIQRSFADLNCIAHIVPDFMKINHHLTEKVATDSGTRDFINLLNKTAEKTFSFLIAEGIESLDQCRAMSEMRIGFGQGFLFGLPKADMVYVNKVMSNWELEASDLNLEELKEQPPEFWEVA